MKKLLLFASILFVGCVSAPAPGMAFNAHDISEPLERVRRLGLSLGTMTDRASQDPLIELINKTSADIDDAIASVERESSLTSDMAANLQEIKALWTEYRKTRDEQIIPEVLAGNRQKAKMLSTTIQLGRYRRMLSLLRSMDATAQP